MRLFSVGGQVVVRYGARQGRAAEVYKVRLTGGALLFDSEGGLSRPAGDGPRPPLPAVAG
jgi:hypothetical protein